jgi:thiamine-phosphate pyrophosphorylase
VTVLPRLYAVLDRDVADRFGWRLDDLARACLAGGARLLQIRAKHLASGALLELSERIAAAADAAGARLIVNDRADVAALAGAWGVHVGQEDLPPQAVRAAFGERLTVGLSTHTRQQIHDAPFDLLAYLAVGPVFQTATKDTGYEPVGLDLVRVAAAASAPRAVPIVAIGGIDLERAPRVIAAGASSVAVIGDLFTGGDPEARTRAYVERLEDPGHENAKTRKHDP